MSMIMYKIKSNYMYYLDKNKIFYSYIFNLFVTEILFKRICSALEGYVSCDFYFNITKRIFIVYYAVTCRGRRPSHLGCEEMYLYAVILFLKICENRLEGGYTCPIIVQTRKGARVTGPYYELLFLTLY
jgi:hypothetical protein